MVDTSKNPNALSNDVQKKEDKPGVTKNHEKAMNHAKKNHAKATTTKKPAAAAAPDVDDSLIRRTPGHIRVSLESFPYYLCKITEKLLISTAHLNLVRSKKEMAPTSAIPSLSKFQLLSGPQGSEVYQERLAMAVAKRFNATLLMFDPLPQPLGDSSSAADTMSAAAAAAAAAAPPAAAAAAAEDDDTQRVFNSTMKLLTAVYEDCQRGPVVVFLSDTAVNDIETSIAKNTTLSSYMKEYLGLIPGGILVVGSQVLPEEGKEEKPLRPAGGPDDLLSVLDGLWRMKQSTKTQQPKQPSKLFLSKIAIRMPPDEAQRETWKLKLDRDAETLRARRNNAMIRSTLACSGWSCKDLKKIWIRDRKLTHEFVSRMVGYAILNHLQSSLSEGDAEEEDAVISSESIKHGFRLLEDIDRADKISSKSSPLKYVAVTENGYEKRLLADVIPSDELGVRFEDVGALDNVKDALRESVMLPLQRPELFSHGQLMKPCKGILLFGPPGTGKTMLAKAVATEAGANFINVSASSITSKWYGEAEKYAKAVFTLASKIAPAVVFIDEVDSMLSCRGSSGESEASRWLKNEFMMNWDGLRTKDEERVLVLAATNRPFDLDEAVIRRFPRRLMVGLPDSSNRHKILRVILSKEELARDVDLVAIANMTDGYSGSDLKHLCVVAAHRRIREILENEKNSAVVSDDTRRPGAHIRPLKMDDFKYAHEQVGASTSSQSANTSQLLDWNNQYGEGESRKKQVLTYFL